MLEGLVREAERQFAEEQQRRNTVLGRGTVVAVFTLAVQAFRDDLTAQVTQAHDLAKRLQASQTGDARAAEQRIEKLRRDKEALLKARDSLR